MTSRICNWLLLVAAAVSPLRAQRTLIQDFVLETTWTDNDKSPRFIADVTGDGKGDIVGFATNGAWVSRNTATGFAAKQQWSTAFGQTTGWATQNEHPRFLADMDGDGDADIVGFGKDAMFIELSNGTSFTGPQVRITDFCVNKGWTTFDEMPRLIGDLNGDKLPDVLGFKNDGIWVALNRPANKGTFDPPIRMDVDKFTPGLGWTTQNKFPRFLADVNGDGKADLIGAGQTAVYVALGNGNGSFTALSEWGNMFTGALGWASQNDLPRLVADVNGDGKADLIGAGLDGVYVALAATNGFGMTFKVISDFGQSLHGWTTQAEYPRVMGDLDGDGKAEIVGFAEDSVYEYSFPYARPALATGARIDITPTENGFQGYLGGYKSRYNTAGEIAVANFPAAGTTPYHPMVRAVALPEGTASGVRVIVSADVLGFTDDLRSQIASEARTKYGLPPEKLILAASHTHSGPVLKDNLDPTYTYELGAADLTHVNSYTAWFKDQVVAAIGQAIANKVTGSFSLAYKSGNFTGHEMERSTTWTTTAGLPSRLQDLPLLLLKDAAGQVRAIVFTYACHPVFNQNAYYHSEYPGVTATILEQWYPGAVAVFLQGAGGDINPRSFGSEWMGAALALKVDEMIAGGGFQTLTGAGRSAMSTPALPLAATATAGPSELLNLTAWKFDSATAPVLLLATGGELVSDLGLLLKDSFKTKVSGDAGRVWVAGYVNTVPGYVPSRPHLQRSTYEGVGSQIYYGWRDVNGNAVALQPVESTLVNEMTKLVNTVNQ